MNEERDGLIHSDEEVARRIVNELLEDAVNRNFQDISTQLGDKANYIPGTARDMQKFIRDGSLVIRVDEQRKNSIALLKNVEGDGVSALVFGSDLIGNYLGITVSGNDPDAGMRIFRKKFMENIPVMAFALSQP